MNIDLGQVKQLMNTQSDVSSYIKRQLEDATENPPYLTDVITGYELGGIFVLQELEAHYNENRDNDAGKIKFKLLVRYDEFGRKVYPGDIVRRKKKKPEYKSPTKPMTVPEIAQAKMDGSYDKMFISYNDYIVDKKGCIHCEYSDAVHFLSIFGWHGKRNVRISKFHNKETSASPAKVPGQDSQMLHVHYWRYAEQDNEMYKALPTLKPRPKETAPEKKSDLTLDNAGN